jgi:hypothetical protein
MMMQLVDPMIHKQLRGMVGAGDDDILVAIMVKIERHEASAIANAICTGDKSDVEKIASIKIEIGVIRL